MPETLLWRGRHIEDLSIEELRQALRFTLAAERTAAERANFYLSQWRSHLPRRGGQDGSTAWIGSTVILGFIALTSVLYIWIYGV